MRWKRRGDRNEGQGIALNHGFHFYHKASDDDDDDVSWNDL